MTRIQTICIIVVLAAVLCTKNETTAPTSPAGVASVKLVAKRVSTLGGSPKALAGAAEISVNATPSVYKLALVDFWLIDSATGQGVSVINPDPANPTYTEDNPLLIDLATDSATQELFAGDSFPGGTYSGYKMQFLYIEMKLPVVFHVPDPSWETEYTSTSILDTVVERHLRLYFNAKGKFWKRDFIAELDSASGTFFWLRREVEDHLGSRNFFISTVTNAHPSGGAGPNNTIDLFHDEPFWGPESLYSDSTSPIIVGSNSTTGGLGCRWEDNITIDSLGDSIVQIDLEIDVTSTMNFWENDSGIPSGVTFVDSTLDLGPGFAGETYGDIGLHPFMPAFRVVKKE